MLAGRERARALVDLDAISRNVARLKARLPLASGLCAVVKANGYGHGAVPAAAAAARGGASWFGVATIAEAEELRAAGFTLPVLIFGPLTGAELARAVAAGADVTVWSLPFLNEARKLGASVHIKFNSGMGRLGVDAATALVLAAGAAAPARLVGLMSHFATADEPDDGFFQSQLDRFLALEAQLKQLHPGLIAHVANSAATVREPRAHRDLVRTGIAIYGLSPFNTDPAADGLEPAMRLSSYVAGIREVQAGESVGYGRRFVAEGPARLAIVPIGYADGICRALTNRGDVLIDGRRCRISGTVSMDQLTVLLPGDHGKPGDEVVFIGRSGDELILCEEMAQLLGTINYEIACDVSARVARRYVGAAAPAGV
jgi:alanine racemase